MGWGRGTAGAARRLGGHAAEWIMLRGGFLPACPPARLPDRLPPCLFICEVISWATLTGKVAYLGSSAATPDLTSQLFPFPCDHALCAPQWGWAADCGAPSLRELHLAAQ